MDIFETTKGLFDSFDYIASQLRHSDIYEAVVAGFLLSKLPNNSEMVVQEIRVYKEMCLKWKLKRNEQVIYFSGIIQKYFYLEDQCRAKSTQSNSSLYNKISAKEHDDSYALFQKDSSFNFISNYKLECNKSEPLNSVVFKMIESNEKINDINTPIIIDRSPCNLSDIKEDGSVDDTFRDAQFHDLNHSKQMQNVCDINDKNNKPDTSDNVMHMPTTDSCLHLLNRDHNDTSDASDRNLNSRLRTKVLEEDKHRFIQIQLEQSIPCVICCKMITGLDFATNRCGHSFHHNCIKAYLINKLKLGRISYKCPANKCTICMEFK